MGRRCLDGKMRGIGVVVLRGRTKVTARNNKNKTLDTTEAQSLLSHEILSEDVCSCRCQISDIKTSEESSSMSILHQFLRQTMQFRIGQGYYLLFDGPRIILPFGLRQRQAVQPLLEQFFLFGRKHLRQCILK
jgi:hypothetical protein